jgi:zinc transporter ZupT
MISDHKGTLKRSIEWFMRTALRARLIVALILMLAGIVVVVVSALSFMANSATLNWLLGVVVGVILILVSLPLFVTELMESWLTQGQRALVDGLQAG